MIVRSYSGRTVAEALDKVRNDLGADALIIETRHVKEGGLLGRKVGYEVVAAGADGQPAAKQHSDKSDRLQQAIQASDWDREPRRETSWNASRADNDSAEQANILAAAASASQRSVAVSEDTIAELNNREGLGLELASIRRQLARLASGQDVPASNLGDELHDHLNNVELPHEIIAECDEALSKANGRIQAQQIPEFLSRYLAMHQPCAGSIDWNRTGKLLVVGPTGVGKTTTIAKLAGDLVLNQGRKVGMVTIDTYRVGAQDQLQTYADLLNMPFAVARTPAQLSEVLENMSDCDNILIDTAGRSPADSARLHELRSFCRSSPGVAVALTAAATAGRAEFASVMERFSLLPIEHTIITKLDECEAPGRLYGCIRRHGLNANYYTTGQEVPNDIQPADARELRHRLMLDRAVMVGQ